MTSANDTITDEHGRAMFLCGLCGQAMGKDDFFDQGMRLPDRGEGRDDYCDAELIDGFEHAACTAKAHASRAG